MKTSHYQRFPVALIFGMMTTSGIAQNALDLIRLTSTEPAAVAYSLRKLSSTYKGPAIKVFEGNNYKDIGFTSNGDLDTNALKLFCKTGMCHVTKWYDQSGYGRDATPVNTGKPRIVTNGKIERKNGKPTIYFDFNVQQTPSRDDVIALTTKKFTAFDKGFTLFTAAGVKKDINYNTFVTKTNLSQPSPFDMYDNTFIAGHDFMTVLEPIKSVSGFKIWGLSGSPNMNGDAWVGLSSNYKKAGVGNNFYFDMGNPLIIGSRGDWISGLNGWVSEVIVFPKIYPATMHDAYRDILPIVTANLMDYYPGSNELDKLGLSASQPAAVAYSLRQLSSTYKKAAVRVRRSSDNKLADVYFDASGEISLSSKVKAPSGQSLPAGVTTFSQFCKDQDCFVQTWFDQTGHGRHATQKNASQQPRIFSKNNGIETKNAKPTLFFDNDVEQDPSSDKVIALATEPFEAFELGVSIVLAAGVKKNMKGKKIGKYYYKYPNTFISKTLDAVPAPWDMFDDKFAAGKGSCCHNYCQLTVPIDSSSGFKTWGFAASSEQRMFPHSSVEDSYPEAFINSVSTGTCHGLIFRYEEKSSKLVIGSDDIGETALNGWISEVVVFARQYIVTPRETNKEALIMTMNKMVDYYSTVDPLDNLGLTTREQASVAFSLRKLSSAYTGAAIKVRTGTAYKDIGFDSKGNLDLDALKAFCGSGDCYVNTWYDQSGNFQDATQPAYARQPKIVSQGTIQMQNKRPSLFFDFDTKLIPDTSNTIALVTQPFKAFENGFSLFIAAGTNKFNKKTYTYTTFVTKSRKNYPAPWDMYNGDFLVGSGSKWSYDFEVFSLSKTIDKPGNYGIWGFNSGTRPKTAFAYYNNKEISKFHHSGSRAFIYGDDGHPVVIGARNDHFTAFNGWVSEVIAFPKQYPGNESITQRISMNLMAYYVDPSGNALNFAAANKNYVTIGPKTGMYNAGEAYTKEAWVFWTGTPNSSGNIVSSQDAFFIWNGKLSASNNHSVANTIKDPTQFPTNQWVHVAVTYDGKKTLKLYKNGVQVASSGAMVASTATQNYIGEYFSSSSVPSNNLFSGNIDEVRIWNKARSVTDITDNMKKFIDPGTPGLTAYYNFNQGTADGTNTGLATLYDLTKEDFSGSLNGFLLTGTTSNWVKSTVPLTQ